MLIRYCILSLLHCFQLINSLDVDIFGFQEVRLEVGSKIKQKKKGKRKKQSVPTRSQMTDLASQLQGYQFVFQPAMLYMEKLLERKEEGLAIFSLYPIISSDYRLLSRFVIIIRIGDSNLQV